MKDVPKLYLIFLPTTMVSVQTPCIELFGQDKESEETREKNENTKDLFTSSNALTRYKPYRKRKPSALNFVKIL